jgi:hypothetical protein
MRVILSGRTKAYSGKISRRGKGIEISPVLKTILGVSPKLGTPSEGSSVQGAMAPLPSKGAILAERGWPWSPSGGAAGGPGHRARENCHRWAPEELPCILPDKHLPIPDHG